LAHPCPPHDDEAPDRRPGQDAFDVSIVRANVSVPAVSWAMVPGTKTALIRIEEFSQGATADMKKAIAAADKAGATSIVLDLRDNPGGVVNEAIGVASAFMKDGVVYQDRDAQGKVTPHPVNGSDYTTDKPLAVPVDPGSARASESWRRAGRTRAGPRSMERRHSGPARSSRSSTCRTARPCSSARSSG
jgi:C-terminal processing protease CtpA/Prc